MCMQVSASVWLITPAINASRMSTMDVHPQRCGTTTMANVWHTCTVQWLTQRIDTVALAVALYRYSSIYVEPRYNTVQ